MARFRAAMLGPVLVFSTLVASVISSLGAPLIPTVADRWGESITNAQWSLTVALLSGAIAAPVMGRLGDGPHRRATMIGGLAVVTAGGVVAALAPNLVVLVIGRALQGVGLGLVPLTMATARDALPRDRVVPMVALLSVCVAAGVGIGYPVSGVMAEVFGLASAFWFGAAVCGCALVGAAVVLPATPADIPRRRLDWVGAILLAVGLSGVLIAVAQGSTWGWSTPGTVGLLGVGVAALGLWAVQQLRTKAPLVELRLLRHPAVLVGNLCATVLGVAMYMNLSVATQFVQVDPTDGYGFGASAVTAGLILLPMSVLSLAAARCLPWLVRLVGVPTVLAVGCLAVASAAAVFAVWHGQLWQAFLMMGLLGIGSGATYAAIPGLIVSSVPPHETGSAMGFYQVVRYVGFSLGSALTAAVLAAHLTRPGGPPSAQGPSTVLWISAGICVLAALLAWLLPVLHRRTEDREQLSETVVARGSATEEIVL